MATAHLSKQDIVKYITMIRVNFENAYGGSNEERTLLVETWYAILKPYPKEIVGEAVKRVLSHAEFVPRIGNIVNEIERMQQAFSKSDGELWVELNRVLYEAYRCFHSLNCTWVDDSGVSQGERAEKRLKEIFDGLPEEVREYVGSPRQLAAIAEMDDEALTYEKGRFLKAVPTIRSRVQIRKTVSPKICNLLGAETIAQLPPPEDDGDGEL